MTERVVKIQRALNDPKLPGLIYDRGRNYYEQAELAPGILELMGDKPTIYARVLTEGESLTLVAVLPEQDW